MDEHPLVLITIQWLNPGYQVYSWMGVLVFFGRGGQDISEALKFFLLLEQSRLFSWM